MAVQHRPAVFLTVLPAERRSRHPYQLCMMLALITIGASQLLMGAQSYSAISVLPQYEQTMLNRLCILAGAAGVVAALIPERVVRWRLRRRHEFDATWFRLWIEMGCHGALVFVWLSYLVALAYKLPFMQGLSLGSGLVFWLLVAAVWRVVQIAWTIKRAVIDPPESGIIGAKDVPL